MKLFFILLGLLIYIYFICFILAKKFPIKSNFKLRTPVFVSGFTPIMLTIWLIISIKNHYFDEFIMILEILILHIITLIISITIFYKKNIYKFKKNITIHQDDMYFLLIPTAITLIHMLIISKLF